VEVNMSTSITLTEAKVRLSELINRIIYNKEKIFISKKGKNVAALVPLEEVENERNREEGLILAQRGLADLGDEIDEMEKCIYEARENEISREVDI
jgi:prevent-host-death family protein